VHRSWKGWNPDTIQFNSNSHAVNHKKIIFSKTAKSPFSSQISVSQGHTDIAAGNSVSQGHTDIAAGNSVSQGHTDIAAGNSVSQGHTDIAAGNSGYS